MRDSRDGTENSLDGFTKINGHHLWKVPANVGRTE